MGSMAEKPPSRVKMSMAAEVTNMENRDDASRWNPSSFQPTRKMGTFSTNTITPTEIWGRNTLTSKKALNARENSTDPTKMIP